MRYSIHRFVLATLVLSIVPSLSVAKQQQPAGAACTTLRKPAVCPNPDKAPGQLCSDLPHDVNFKQLLNGYDSLIPVCQQPFDDFSWQSFVALNWPLNNLSQPRPWEGYTDPDTIFNGALLRQMRNTTAAEGKLTAAQSAKVKILYKMAKRQVPGQTFDRFLQATQQPLIDRNLNFALFEEKVNPVWAAYVVKGSCVTPNPNACLNTLAGQQAFVNAKKSVKFPPGFYADDIHGRGGRVGAMEIKAAWRILDRSKGDDPKRYYTRVADIYMDAEHTVNKKPLVIKNVLIGLVGLHINTYVKDGKGSVWSTFEQEDNAPLQGEAPPPGKVYSFYNAGCSATDCPPNTAPALKSGESNYLWGTTAPYAQRYATNNQYGTQVTIVNKFYQETEDTNTRWHKLMSNTVWAHYRLIGSQWVNGEVPQHEGIPPLEANSVQETYIQSMSSCISCHADFAKMKTKPPADADLSFLLGHAH